MSDIRERFGAFDRLDMPDLWDAAQQLEPDPGKRERGHERGRKAIVIVTALALTVATTGVLIRAFRHVADTEPVTGDPADWSVVTVPDLGLSFRYPPEWRLQTFAEADPRQKGLISSVKGALVSNTDLEFHHPTASDGTTTTAWDLSALPTDGVFITVDHTSEIGVPLNDTALPLDLSDATLVSQLPDPLGYTPKPPGTEERYLDFTLNGMDDEVRVYFAPKATAETRGAAADVVASIGKTSIPTVSPHLEGTFAFIGSTNGLAGLYTVADDESPRRLLTGVGLTPSWSPDGRSILVNRPIEGSESRNELLIVDVGTGDTRRLTDFRLPNGGGSWAPDGSEIAFTTGYGEVYVIRPDGTGLRQLDNPAGATCADEGVSWSPDGSRLAFVRACEGQGGGVYVVGADGSGLRRVTSDPAVFETAWSPDGRTLAFSESSPPGDTDVYVIDVDGGVPAMLASVAHSPTWSPDGTELAVVRAGNVDVLDLSGRSVGTLDLPVGLSVSAISWFRPST